MQQEQEEEQPRRELRKGDKLGRQGGSGIMTRKRRLPRCDFFASFRNPPLGLKFFFHMFLICHPPTFFFLMSLIYQPSFSSKCFCSITHLLPPNLLDLSTTLLLPHVLDLSTIFLPNVLDLSPTFFFQMSLIYELFVSSKCP